MSRGNQIMTGILCEGEGREIVGEKVTDTAPRGLRLILVLRDFPRYSALKAVRLNH